MQRPRVIPILSLIDNKLVKTVKFKSPKYVGDPINAIKIFNDKLVDELSIIDIKRSFNNQEPNYKLIENMTSECFMPISYGGGIKSFSHAKKIFELGVEKVIINSLCFEDMDLIDEISDTYGSQSIVVSVDYFKNIFGKIKLFSKNKIQNRTDINSFFNKLISSSMGELLITCVNNEGSFAGYDYSLSNILKNVNVPVIVNGGLSSLNDMKFAFKNGFDAVAGSSFFIYQNNNPDSILINYPNPSSIKNLNL